MNPHTFADWLKLQNYSVYKDRNGYWYNQGPKAYQFIPYHKLIAPTSTELESLFKMTGAFVVRYSTGIDQSVGKISYHVVREEPFIIETMPKKVRHDIQHGLNYADYKRISFSQMANEGWKVRIDTLMRQGRALSETKDHWQNLCFAAEGLDGFEAWGAFRDNNLIACLFCAVVDNCAQILYHQSMTDHLKHGINNALAYFVTNEMLNRNGINSVFYGLQSLDAPSSVDEFKFRMGYKAKAVRQRVVFNSKISPMFNRFTYILLKTIHNIFPGNYDLSKAEGIVRFYLEGKLPISKQELPNILNDNNGDL